MKIKGTKSDYEIIEGSVGETDTYILYECILSSGKTGILKIAKEIEHNGILDREALILNTMQEKARDVEEKDSEKGHGKRKLGYQKFFPKLIECFIAEDQGGLYVLVLDFEEVADQLSDLVPLEHIMSRKNNRIDPKTSAWIMGRLLKLLDFAHWQGISVAIFGDNILINCERHRVLIFDWSSSTITREPVQADEARDQISLAAREVIIALGGNPETGELPESSQLTSEWYQEFLFSLVNGKYDNAGEAHTRFYGLVRSAWPSEFHPFTVHSVKKPT